MLKSVVKTSCVQVYNTCISHEPAMSKYKAHDKCSSMKIQNKRALFLCQLSVSKYTQSCTILGYGYIWHISVWSHQTSMFQHIVHTAENRGFIFLNDVKTNPIDKDKISSNVCYSLHFSS